MFPVIIFLLLVKYTGKAKCVITPTFTHSSLCVLDFSYPAFSSNFAELPAPDKSSKSELEDAIICARVRNSRVHLLCRGILK
jgi:hypothetical protein